MINEWGQEARSLYSSFLKWGTWESSSVPNIELTMMQLILEKLWKQILSLHAETTRNFNYPRRCLQIGIQHIQTDKIAEQLTKLRNHGWKKPWMEGRLEYTMLPMEQLQG
jgi:hypothetical protein